MFSDCTVPPDGKEIQPGSSDQEASPLAGKNTRVVLVACHTEKCVPTACFQWCGYFRGPWVSSVTMDDFSVRVTKVTSWIGVSRTHDLPFCF